MAPKNFMSGIFGRSPVRPLQQHMAKVVACVSELPEFFDASIKGEWDRADRARAVDLHHRLGRGGRQRGEPGALTAGGAPVARTVHLTARRQGQRPGDQQRQHDGYAAQPFHRHPHPGQG
jgi:hypothetical protein